MKILFIIVALAAAALPVFVPSDNRRLERRLFWTGFIVAPLAILGFTYPDWGSGALLGLLALALMLMNAYFGSANLKFGKRIFSFNLRDSQPDAPSDTAADPNRDPAPDSYSGVATARKFWWLMPVSMFICTFNVVVPHPEKPWAAPLMATVGVAVAFGIGHVDASWGYPVARGQRLQFAIVCLITAGAFALFYLAGYRLGVRRPLRRRTSTEYQAHPHLRRTYPQDS